jgi:hypothetical protein|tara:strand:+ start:400 stop:573 length:174 start_codon:yes stop_codon:yes gene_type:complete
MEALLILLSMAQGATFMPGQHTPRPVIQTSTKQEYFRGIDEPTSHSWIDAGVFFRSK